MNTPASQHMERLRVHFSIGDYGDHFDVFGSRAENEEAVKTFFASRGLDPEECGAWSEVISC